LDELTRDRPKVMIPVAGKPVLRRQVDKFKKQGINDITVVAGYHADAIKVQGARVVVNEAWQDSGELASLACAREAIGNDTVLIYGDLLFRTYILHNLLDWDSDLLVVVDSTPLEEVDGNRTDLAWCSAPDNRAMYQQKVALQRVSPEPAWQGRPPDGRWIGMLRARGAGAQRLRDALATLERRADFARLGLPDLLNQLVADGPAPQVQYVNGHWLDLNNVADLERAGIFERERGS
jgi:phosphoenolpyruvate phosphomutase